MYILECMDLVHAYHIVQDCGKYQNGHRKNCTTPMPHQLHPPFRYCN